VQDAARITQQLFARIGRAHIMPGTLQKRLTSGFLQPYDLLAHRGLGRVQLQGRSCKTAAVDNGHEGPQKIETESSIHKSTECQFNI
jgi:hypothetical protein